MAKVAAEKLALALVIAALGFCAGMLYTIGILSIPFSDGIRDSAGGVLGAALGAAVAVWFSARLVRQQLDAGAAASREAVRLVSADLREAVERYLEHLKCLEYGGAVLGTNSSMFNWLRRDMRLAVEQFNLILGSVHQLSPLQMVEVSRFKGAIEAADEDIGGIAFKKDEEIPKEKRIEEKCRALKVNAGVIIEKFCAG